MIVGGAAWIFIEERKGGSGVGSGLIEGVHAEAFAAGHGEVGEGFAGAVGLAVVMCEDFGHFGQAIAAAAFDFLGDLQMQRRARFGKQALVERVPYQRMLKHIVARLALRMDQIERLHRREPGIDVCLA